jgi:hypothetical protein
MFLKEIYMSAEGSSSPIVKIAAVAVIISAVGVGMMTGIIPSEFKNAAQKPPKSALIAE